MDVESSVVNQAKTKEKLSRVACYFKWHFRKAGGLFIGLRISFPTNILFCNGEVRPTVHIDIGCLIFSIDIEFRGKVVDTYDKSSDMFK
jgi:hypothetical protein